MNCAYTSRKIGQTANWRHGLYRGTKWGSSGMVHREGRGFMDRRKGYEDSLETAQVRKSSSKFIEEILVPLELDRSSEAMEVQNARYKA